MNSEHECTVQDDTKDGWQDISTAPRDGTRVLLYEPENDDSGPPQMDCGAWFVPSEHEYVPIEGTDAYRLEFKELLGRWDSVLVSNPSHWMPLPPPPEGA